MKPPSLLDTTAHEKVGRDVPIAPDKTTTHPPDHLNQHCQQQLTRIKMKTNHALAAPRWTAVLLILTLALCVSLPPACTAGASPPETMSYQGFLVDGAGQALGLSAPKNYDIIFRIWNDQTGGQQLWAEQQTVTVDKGYFSVLLGEGSQAGSHPRPALSTLFRATDDVSDRFVEITVKGIGAGSPPEDVTILPRLRLLTAPYAFLAQSAVTLVSGTNAVISTLLNNVGINTANPSAQLDVNGTVKATDLNVAGPVTAASFAGNGASLTHLDASKITSGTLDSARVPNLDAAKIASGTLDGARIPATFTGNRIFNGSVSIGTSSAPQANLDVAGTVKLFSVPGANTTWTPNGGNNDYLVSDRLSESPATTDGFLSVIVEYVGPGHLSAGVTGFVDKQLCGAASVNYHYNVDFPVARSSFMMPVPKGSSWSLTATVYGGLLGGYGFSAPKVTIRWTTLGR